MTKEDKNLLIKDLCARVPYNTMVSIAEGEVNEIKWNKVALNFYLLYQIEEEDSWEFIKPYLRPMSNMTEEEWEEYDNFCDDCRGAEYFELIDWLNSHHFDYRNLIERQLAIAVTEKNSEIYF